MKELLARLLEHNDWADRRVLAGLRQASHASLAVLELTGHLLGAEAIWLARLEGRSSTVAVWPRLSVSACEALVDENRTGYAAFLGRLDEAALARPVHYVNSAGQAFDSRVDDILMHVALHGSYHRGQISSALRAAGVAPLPSDYIAFVRGTAAATRR